MEYEFHSDVKIPQSHSGGWRKIRHRNWLELGLSTLFSREITYLWHDHHVGVLVLKFCSRLLFEAVRKC